MTLEKKMLRMMTAAVLVAGLALAAPAAAQDIAVRVQNTRAPTGARTGFVGLGNTASNRVYIKNNGTAPAAGVDVTVDSTGWPADQVITGVSNCIPAPLPAGVTARTNANWFPCRYATPVGIPGVLTAAAIAPGAEPYVGISVKYGTAVKKSDIYQTDADGNYLTDANGDLIKITAAWTCPAVDRFAVVKASATTTTAGDLPGDNAAEQTAPPEAVWADLSVSMTGPASISRDGGSYTYTYTVTNHGPCTVTTDTAVDDSVPTGFKFASATGACAALTDDFLADGTDYQYCDLVTLAPGETSAESTKTYTAPTLPSDLLSSNQGTGIQITFGNGDFADPNSSNNTSDVTYVLTKSMGCSAAGGGASFMLIGLGLAALFLKRRRGA
jgi:uncharacterized repeat protein (TIGR01451 family)/uncharacterized protein (TIGR03382 family)